MRNKMKTNLIVSSRGQLTLPSELRKKYGIDEGSVLIVDDRNGEIVQKIAQVTEVEFYSDFQINGWVKEDVFEDASNRQSLRSQLKKLAKAK